MNLKSAQERLRQRTEELTHTAKKALGQNFLVSDHVIDKIISASHFLIESQNLLSTPHKVVEIGPGLGALTDLISQVIFKNQKHELIEFDHSLAKYWEMQGFTVHDTDALQFDWQKANYSFLISNLPYQISSSIVIDRSMDQQPLKGMVLMFQKEVAQRIRAKEKTEEYGMLSVVAQEFWEIKTVCDAGPKDFSPPPKIASRVLQFNFKTSQVKNKTRYLEFVKTCFKQRRRILKSNLPRADHENFLNWVQKYKLSEKIRVEELNPNQIRDLYFFLGKE